MSLRRLTRLAVLLIAPAVCAEQLPLRSYTSADGLRNDRVHSILRDSHGFLWFATSDGLSRFDGARFVPFGREQGLPATSINQILENRDGTFWVATNGDGIVLFTLETAVVRATPASAAARFRHYDVARESPTNRVNTIYRDRAGVLWLGTDGGLFRAEQEADGLRIRREELGIRGYPDLTVLVSSFAEDRDGNLWIGTRFGLIRREPDGRRTRFTIQPRLDLDVVSSILLDHDGRLWVGHQAGLLVWRPPPLPKQSERTASDRYSEAEATDSLRIVATEPPPARLQLPERPGEAQFFALSAGAIRHGVSVLAALDDGRIWIGTQNGGVFELNGTSIQPISPDPRLRRYGISAIAQDPGGSVWLGTVDQGALRLATRGVLRYGVEDGLGAGIRSMFSDRSGEVVVASGDARISRFDGKRFVGTDLKLVRDSGGGVWSSGRPVLQDHLGEWWIGTRNGLYRLPRTDHAEQLGAARAHRYTRAEGFPEEYVTRLFEDSRGDVWVGTFNPAHEVLTRWERATGRFHRYSDADGLVAFNAPLPIVEDHAGDVWIGFREGGLARWHAGRFQWFGAEAGLPMHGVRECFVDHAGRIWCSITEAGLLRIDAGDGPQPRFRFYTTRDGLSSNNIDGINEDSLGHIYAASSLGVDRLDVQTGERARYSTSDGLAPGTASQIYRDPQGDLWLVMFGGLTRLRPSVRPEVRPSAPRITGLWVGGVNYQLPADGVANLELGDLPPQDNAVEIEYSPLNFATSQTDCCRHRLEGAEREWSGPSGLPTVNYAALAPGRYRFLVAAETGAPASVSFRVLPPVWRRWWFLAAIASVLLVAMAAFARSRVARLRVLRESESRFRTLAETASDAVLTIDETGVIVYANPAAEHVFGYAPGELVGRELVQLMPERMRPAHQAGFARYRHTGERRISWQAIELPGLHRDGQEMPLELSFGEFTRDGRRYFTGIARDISERKRAEEALHRSREERLAELERVRRRIATDLHDDVGSSLTQISVLSEVAQQQAGSHDTPINSSLSLIAATSRELVDSMSDIVWAITPQRDHLSDLTHRMRRFASDSFTARNITFDLRLPASEHDRKLEGNLRRELFLIFKEAVNNTVKHSGCSEAAIRLAIHDGTLQLELRDNGKGFDPALPVDGHGLSSLRTRAAALGGTLAIVSAPGAGTAITLDVPIPT